MTAETADPYAETPRLTYEQAVAMLPPGGTIHIFINPAGILVGEDWDRDHVLALLRTGEPQLSGPAATSMNHGIVAARDEGSVFIETAPGAAEKIAALIVSAPASPAGTDAGHETEEG
jgi:hypothetical protein